MPRASLLGMLLAAVTAHAVAQQTAVASAEGVPRHPRYSHAAEDNRYPEQEQLGSSNAALSLPLPRRQLLRDAKPEYKCGYLGTSVRQSCIINPNFVLSTEIPMSNPVGKAVWDLNSRQYKCFKHDTESSCKGSCAWTGAVCLAQTTGWYQPERGFLYCPDSKMDVAVTCAGYGGQATCLQDARCRWDYYGRLALTGAYWWGFLLVNLAFGFATANPTFNITALAAAPACFPSWMNDTAQLTVVAAAFDAAKLLNGNRTATALQFLPELVGSCASLSIGQQWATESCYQDSDIVGCWTPNRLNTIFGICDWFPAGTLHAPNDTGPRAEPAECVMGPSMMHYLMYYYDDAFAWSRNLSDTSMACDLAYYDDSGYVALAGTQTRCQSAGTFIPYKQNGAAAGVRPPFLLACVLLVFSCLVAFTWP